MKYSLVGVDGNAFGVMGYVVNAMKKEGKDEIAVSDYLYDARQGSYDSLLAISASMVDELNGE